MMNDREFLKKIRSLIDNGQKISVTEMSVGSENIITESKINQIKRLINENKTLIKEEEIQTIDPDEQREEENKFKDIVSKLVKFNPIKVHKENVEWSGHLIREKIDWYFSLDDTIGCYIDTTDLIQLRDETLETLLTGGSAEETESTEELEMGTEEPTGEEGGEEDTEFGF
jgi:hypothetical protein